MQYTFDNYYKGTVDFKKIVLITANYCATFTKSYTAKLLTPQKGVKENVRTGELQKNSIPELLRWITQNSTTTDTYKLLLYKHFPIEKNESPIFCYYESCCWYMDLSDEQFKELKKILHKEGLPEDLFHLRDQTVCVPSKGFWGWLGIKKCYSPKQWQEVNATTKQ